ncbi:hypothetical protein HDU96_004776 [Phlyctochytrium bullatum]|nr:hypothetical protein HDU96_004776 [Phlyctochytrium bullatum]
MSKNASTKHPSRTVLITGATSGVGKEAARVLASGILGDHTVIVASRNPEKIKNIIASIVSAHASADGRIHALTIDVGSLTSVRETVEKDLATLEREKGVRVDTLVMNAAVVCATKQMSKDGLEQTFATNYLGHFYLERLLRPKLVANAKAAGIKPRTIIVSSGAHNPENHMGANTPVYDPADWLNPRSYNPGLSYVNSKLANTLHGNDLAATLSQSPDHPTIAIYDPGFIGDTGLMSPLGFMQPVYATVVWMFMQFAPWWYGSPSMISNTEKSGMFLARLAVDPELPEENGAYYSIETRYETSKVTQDKAKQVEVREFSVKLLRERGYAWT